MPAKTPLATDAASVAARNAHRAEYAAAPSDALFPVATVATVGCTTAKTLEAWRSVGRGPSWVRVGRNVRYRRRDIEAWLSGRDAAEPVRGSSEKSLTAAVRKRSSATKGGR